MRPLLLGAAAALVLAPLPAPAAEFLSCFEDLPLMEGLAEPAGTCVNFDTPSGRIALGEAEGRVAAAAVRDFYREILPAFGWTVAEADGLVLEREDERLLVTVSDAPAGGVLVRYALAPRR